MCEKERADLKARSGQIEASLGQVQGNLSTSRQELEALRKWKGDAAKRMQTFRDMSAKLQKMVDAGKLGVRVRDGRLVMRLPQDVLFPSGVADLSREGELALMEVAVILKQFPDRRFMVAGHTDNQPVKETFKDNWELSMARALVVTRFLVEAKMKPQNIVAAGYGEHDPIAKTPRPRVAARTAASRSSCCPICRSCRRCRRTWRRRRASPSPRRRRRSRIRQGAFAANGTRRRPRNTVPRYQPSGAGANALIISPASQRANVAPSSTERHSSRPSSRRDGCSGNPRSIPIPRISRPAADPATMRSRQALLGNLSVRLSQLRPRSRDCASRPSRQRTHSAPLQFSWGSSSTTRVFSPGTGQA